MSPRRHALVVRTNASVGVLVSVLAGLLLGLGPGAWAQPADDVAAAPTCNGRTPTMEGSPGETILGTAGDDVIITNGAARVDTGAGNDSICITGKGPVIVNAGPGDDFVGARAHRGRTFVSLGFGDDTFLGGDGPDRVWSQESSNQTSADDHDVILTYGGDDYVISGSSTAPNTDIVALGTGDDVLVTYGFSSGAALSGGPGTNSYQPLPGPGLGGRWNFDNVEGEATLDDITRLTWRGFQQFNLTGVQGDFLRFRGSNADESVIAGAACQVVLRGRGGDDRLTVDQDGCNGLPAGDALLVGGAGNDVLKGAGGDDVLRGGGGRDFADGGAGENRCLAEATVNC